MRKSVPILLVLTVAGALPAEEHRAPQTQPWTYVVPEPDAPMEHPPLQPLHLQEARFDGLQEAVRFRGARRLYGLLRYGSPDSRRVPIVLDEIAEDEFDLYVDSDRDWLIENDERAEGTGAWRRTPPKTNLLTAQAEAEDAARALVFRRSISGSSLGVATRGYLEGQVWIGERPLAVRRLDGNANGLLSDPSDRIWIDLNEDGQWDAFTEQFPLSPILELDNVRYVVRSDPVGKSLSLQKVTATGTFRLQLESIPQSSAVLHLEVMLASDDGSAFAIRDADEAITVPVGRYALSTVTITLQDSATQTPWSFVFSSLESTVEEKWYDLTEHQEAVIDPIGKLRFELELSQKLPAVAGTLIAVQPRLYTADGLLINTCSAGKDTVSSYETSASAMIWFGDRRDRDDPVATSGFA